MDVQERNKIVEEHQNMVWCTIFRNRSLLIALGLEKQDVFQELMIVMMKAVESFNSEKGKLNSYLFQKLQYGVLDIKRKHCPHGITRTDGSRPEVCSIDVVYDDGNSIFDIPVEDDLSTAELTEILRFLTATEREAVKLQSEGHFLRKKSQKDSVTKARKKITQMLSA